MRGFLIILIIVAIVAGGGYAAFQQRYKTDSKFRWEMYKVQRAWERGDSPVHRFFAKLLEPVSGLTEPELKDWNARHWEDLRRMGGAMNAQAWQRMRGAQDGRGDATDPSYNRSHDAEDSWEHYDASKDRFHVDDGGTEVDVDEGGDSE